MMPRPVRRAVRGSLTRKRIQTFVIALVVLVSTGASVLAIALLVDSNAPFEHAFATQHGAHVAMTVDSAKTTPAQLAATGTLPQVTAASGPFAEVSVDPKVAGLGQQPVPPITLAGRASPGGPVDDVVLQSGHWPHGLGQVVVAVNQEDDPLAQLPLGTKFSVEGMHGKVTLTIVGTANSVTNSAGGWVLPGEIGKLRSPGETATAEMLYRFRSAASDAAIRADIKAVAAALPSGAVVGTQSYLAAGLAESGNIAPFVPFLIAFGVIGLVMSVLIVANVVSGAVVSGYRRIGVLKSVGFTPSQVVVAYATQAAVPALVGCIGGLLLGNVLAVPVLSKTAHVYGVGALRVPAWVDIAVPAAMFGLVAIAAMLPALRAGRLNAVQAIAIGRAPRTGHGYAAHRVLGRLRLPRPVTIGLAAPFARPARMAVTMTAILLGASLVTFAVGLSTSLNLVVEGLSHKNAEPVQVLMPPSAGIVSTGPHGGLKLKVGPGAAAGRREHGPTVTKAERTIQTALASQPGTLHYVAESDQNVTVAGLAQQVSVTAFRGKSSWTGYDIITGHWFSGPGQVDVAPHFLTVTGKSVGDSVTMLFNGKQISARIVGEIFDTENTGLSMVTDWQTLAQVDAHLAPNLYDVGLTPGTSVNSYVNALSTRLGQPYFVAINARSSDVVQLMIGLIGTLTLLLTIVAGLGVLNTIVLHTRERVHDLGVFKAVGMTPRQTIAMVVCLVGGTGLLASVLAVPAGVELHKYVLPAMAHSVDLAVPTSFVNVYHGSELAALGLAGIVIAIAGALLPASWAAATRTGAALHAE